MITEGTKSIYLKVGDKILHNGSEQKIFAIDNYVDVICITLIGKLTTTRTWFLPQEVVNKVIDQ
jgi:hypothetical protein